MCNRSRVWAQMITVGIFHIYVMWGILISSQVGSNSLLGRAFPYAAGYLASKCQWCPFHLLLQPKMSLEMSKPFFGGGTAHIESHRAYPSSSWFGWRHGNLGRGKDLRKVTWRASVQGRLEAGPPVCQASACPLAWLTSAKWGVVWALLQCLCNLAPGKIFLSIPQLVWCEF